MSTNKKFTLMIFFCLIFFLFNFSFGQAEEEENETVPIIMPKINLTIPNMVSLSQVAVKPGQDTEIPWISEYIFSIYRYLVIIGSVIAVLVIMVGGIMYLLAGAMPSNIQKAKDVMLGAVSGLILLLGSNLLLRTINPNLVLLKPITITGIAKEEISFEEYVDKDIGAPASVTTPKKLSDPTYDAIFQKFASCIPTDWHILKVMAFKESSLDADVVNKSGFVGLFQTKPKFCKAALKSYSSWANKCGDSNEALKDPELNTAVGSMMLKDSINSIKKNCPSAALRDKLTLIYVGHNSGAGALKATMKSGCATEQLAAGLDNFWKTYKGGKYADLNINNKRFKYAQSVADLMLAQGVTSFEGQSAGACPLN